MFVMKEVFSGLLEIRHPRRAIDPFILARLHTNYSGFR